MSAPKPRPQCAPPVEVPREGAGEGSRRRIRATLAEMDATVASMPSTLCVLLEAGGVVTAWRAQLLTAANAPEALREAGTAQLRRLAARWGVRL